MNEKLTIKKVKNTWTGYGDGSADLMHKVYLNRFATREEEAQMEAISIKLGNAGWPAFGMDWITLAAVDEMQAFSRVQALLDKLYEEQDED